MSATESSHRCPRQILALGAGLAALLAACGEEPTAPTTPEPAPAAAEAATTAPLRFRMVSAGYSFNCGVTTDDRAYCWGNNGSGQLGDGTTTARTRPHAVKGGLRFRHVNAGTNHVCGVTTDDRLYCWGFGDDGQLGNGSTSEVQSTPVLVSGGRRWRQVRAGSSHTCGVTMADIAFCWGRNLDGQLGVGDSTDRLVPVRVLGGLHWEEVTSGATHTCGLTLDNRAYCWGAHAGADLTGTDQLQPTRVPGSVVLRRIEAGSGHTCGIGVDDRAYCWGFNTDGEVGTGSSTYYYDQPVLVSGSRRYAYLNAGNSHTCAVARSERMFCWGFNGSGELGDGTGTTRTVPTAVAGDHDWLQVSSGVTHTCAVDTDQHAWCWGSGLDGELGIGMTPFSRLVPVAVAGPS
jgi:alpha-tubulin suppressor-like RCC1 family protein